MPTISIQPLWGLRKTLFDLLSGSPKEAALAKNCLIAIDRIRDEHGIAANDTRHPDVMSERPWPLGRANHVDRSAGDVHSRQYWGAHLLIATDEKVTGR